MMKFFVATLILGFTQLASAIDAATLVGTWVGPGTATVNGKVACEEMVATWKLSMKGDLLYLDSSIYCPATKETSASPLIVAQLKGGKIALKYGKLTIPGSGGTYTDDSLTATMYIPGALNISASIGPIKDGVAPISVQHKGLFTGTLDVKAVLTKQP